MKRKPTVRRQISRLSLKSSGAGIRCAAYSVPKRSVAIAELAAAGLIASTPEQLGHLGFRRLYVADGETAYDLTPSGGSGGGGAFAMAGIAPSIDADGKADVSQKVAG